MATTEKHNDRLAADLAVPEKAKVVIAGFACGVSQTERTRPALAAPHRVCLLGSRTAIESVWRREKDCRLDVAGSDDEFIHLLSGSCCDLAIVEIGRPMPPRITVIRDVRHAYPWLPIFAYSQLECDLGRRLTAALAGGASEFGVYGFDDFGSSIARLVQTSRESQAGVVVWARLERIVPGGLTELIRFWLLGLSHGHNVDAAAEAFGVARRTLFNYCELHRWPSPSITLSWLRLMTAVQLSSQTLVPVRMVAREIGYSGAQRLNALPKRLLGVPLNAAINLGLEGVATRFEQLVICKQTLHPDVPLVSVAAEARLLPSVFGWKWIAQQTLLRERFVPPT